MKRFLFIIASCLIISGCTTVDSYTPQTTMKRRFVSLRQIREGMSKAEVKSVLGDKIVVGYELKDINSDQYSPVVEQNPYRSEVIERGRRKYVVDYYLTGIIKSDGLISDDELVPLVFENDRLLGYGWGFFNQTVR